MEVNFSLDGSGAIAIIALLVSAYATWKTVRFNQKQEELIKSQAELNSLLVKAEKEALRKASVAEVRARFVNLGKNKDRLRIYNVGDGSARNVTITFPEGEDFTVGGDFDAKIPCEKLDKQESINIMASFHLGSQSKYAAVLEWDDDYQQGNKREVWLTRP